VEVQVRVEVGAAERRTTEDLGVSKYDMHLPGDPNPGSLKLLRLCCSEPLNEWNDIREPGLPWGKGVRFFRVRVSEERSCGG